MEHAETIHQVARAIYEEYRYYQPSPRWDDLHEDAKGCWAHLARVAINTYNAANAATKGTT